ncbi:acylneuraminate cytidylyltransferase [Chitinophaga agrisoli]|uniref:Acylneuraminate cytidylyltransferase n=1 Tax=Chitinophaga agrisoli TaxID=2607653 RepID=A0A5B2VYB1_9BACT|nr:glycosyltransferase family protein [Chitinophaga agrisoli]KAA2243540.1 acylneuraminate cytidylyltransferase [Chitinophaga agrisoli]
MPNAAERHLKIVTVIQTRMGSSRLPGKVMMPILDRPLFVRQVERVRAASLTGTIVVAATVDPADDIIAATCEQEGILCYRGDVADLLDRHYQVGLQHAADVVIKIPSDCPLIDPAVIDKVIGFYLDNKAQYDYVSNLHPASYPDGNDVEVMSFAALEETWKQADKQLEREHTTPYIWEHPERFRIGNVVMEGHPDYSMDFRFTIDYQEDYLFIKAVYEALYETNPQFTVTDILVLLAEREEMYAINRQWAGVNWYRHHLDELKTITPQQTKILTTEI